MAITLAARLHFFVYLIARKINGANAPMFNHLKFHNYGKECFKESRKGRLNPISRNRYPESTVTPHIIVAQQKFGRWYVYFQGVRPEENVGCGCKTAKSAIRYMHLLKHRYGAIISQSIYDRIKFDADRGV